MPPMPQNMNNMDNGMGDNMDAMGGDDLNGEEQMTDDFGDSEELDPKKEIQKLTGKLSQTLRKYNDEQSEPDSELNKYVAGMLSKQFSKALNQEDKDEVIKKINSNSETDDLDVDSELPQDDSLELQECSQIKNRRIVGKMIKEIANSIISDNAEDKDRKEKKMRLKTNKKSPFISNR